MTQKYFVQQAALIVRHILAGGTTPEVPLWADYNRRNDIRYMRAVRAAECFIQVAETWNKRFDRDAFILACGLKESV